MLVLLVELSLKVHTYFFIIFNNDTISTEIRTYSLVVRVHGVQEACAPIPLHENFNTFSIKYFLKTLFYVFYFKINLNI